MRKCTRTFGRARPYISPRARRARHHARIATAMLLLGGVALSFACYALMGMAGHEYGQRFGDLAGVAMLAGIMAMSCFLVALAAAGEC